MAAAVSSEKTKFMPRWMPAAICIGVKPSLFGRFQISTRRRPSPGTGRSPADACRRRHAWRYCRWRRSRSTSPPSASVILTASSASDSVPGSSPGKGAADSCGHHQRSRPVGDRDLRVGPEIDEQPHQLEVGGPGREEERRRADEVELRRPHRDAPRGDFGVNVGAVRDERLHELEARHVAGALRRRIVAAGFAHFPDPRREVKRGPSTRCRIRVGAPVQEVRRQLEMSVAGGQQEGVEVRLALLARHATGRFHRAHRERLVESRPEIEQGADRSPVPFAGGEQQRGEADSSSGPRDRRPSRRARV